MSGHYSSTREWKAPSWVSQADKTVSFPASDDSFGQRLESINWSSESLVKFNKNFYKEHPDVASRTEADVRKIREDMGITIYGHNVPSPVLTFQEANFPDYILRTLSDAKFVKPTSIQSQGKNHHRLATSPQWKRHDRHCTNRFRENFGLHPSSNNSHKRSRKVKGNFYLERRWANWFSSFSNSRVSHADLR
jgi:hypothetical protein